MCRYRYSLFLSALIVLLLNSPVCIDAQGDRVVHMAKSRGRVYELLGMLSAKTGKMFIYDSDVINNDRKTKIAGGDYTLEQAVAIIVGDSRVKLKEIGNHVLIDFVKDENALTVRVHHSSYEVIEGKIIDVTTREPIEYATVSIYDSSVGVVANSDGYFRLSIPDSLSGRNVMFSHLGYQTKVLNVELLRQQKCTVELPEYVTTLQEIVVRMKNPILLLDEMTEHKQFNYPVSPYRMTAFYREGVEYNNHFVKLSEGVFDVYKPPYYSSEREQVKLLKKRVISLRNNKDSVVTRIKAGIEACMILDIIKGLPDFMQFPNDSYNYFSTGITTVDDRTANTIYFEQKHHVNEPLYCGELYIDSENHALLGSNFEINPKYVSAATDMFIERKAKGLRIVPQKISYNVTYKRVNGRYYVNYVRGDMKLKIKTDRMFFSSSHTHLWFEMATCDVDTANVVKYSRKDLISKTTIFDEDNYVRDDDFWAHLNVIPMESGLEKSIGNISLKIEEMLGTDK
jgi:hypothetical protein